jgi:hypothetical protein
MNRKLGMMMVAFGLSLTACATTAVDSNVSHEGLEHVSRISSLAAPYSWSRLDDDTILLWTSPSKPYLVDLSRKAYELRFANTIAVTSSAGSIYEKFDSVIVDGIRYPIAGIYKLDRETAKLMQRDS